MTAFVNMEEISLRPLSLKPGGGNPFAAFASGAGMGLKKAQSGDTTGDAEVVNGDAGSLQSSQKSMTSRQNRDDVKKYSSEFLMKFADKYTRLPTELQFGNIEIIMDPSDVDNEGHRDAQRKFLQKIAAGGDLIDDKDDDKDWRSHKKGDERKTKPTSKIQKASDLGRTAWAAGAEESRHEQGTQQQVLRKMKGILNKLTPEKFERLLGQLIPLITSHEILQGTIALVFENAVAQPTFVAMYANLCAELDSILPEFAGADGKPESFRKMLANTCQEEYEATESARNAAGNASSADKEEVQARAKNRLLGNVRLIAELFRKGMVNDRIMLLILSDLLGPADNNPPEDSLEAACELVTVAGSALESTPRSKSRLDTIFNHFTRLSNTSSYAPRIRFVVKDVVDLRSQNWVARRETYTAKKLDEIRTEAQAELGIVDVEIPGLTPLISTMDNLPGGSNRGDDVELFPAFKGNLSSASASESNNEGKFTSLLGQFVPITESSSAAESGDARAARTDLSDEDRLSLGKSLFTDFLSSDNVLEAVSAAQELVVPGFGIALVDIGINRAYENPNIAEQSKISSLLVDLVAHKAVGIDDLVHVVGQQANVLDDTMLDVPSAPKILGEIMGAAIAKNLTAMNNLVDQAKGIEGAEARRGLVVGALHQIRTLNGENDMIEMLRAANVNMAALCQRDDEIESYLPDTAEFLSESGLDCLL